MELLEIAENTEEEKATSRALAMNVLQKLYRNNSLGESVKVYIAKGVEVTIAAFKSDNWVVSFGFKIHKSMFQLVCYCSFFRFEILLLCYLPL